MFKKFFIPPKFEDEEINHTVSQLWIVVLVMAAMSTIYVIAWLALVPEYSIRILFALPLFPLYAWMFFLLRRGKVNMTATVLVVGIWIVLFVAASFSGGVLAPGYSGMLITVLAAGIFMSKGWAIRISWLSVLAGGVLVFLDRQGFTPKAGEFTDPTTMWISQAVYFFIAASLLQMATQRISSALGMANREIEQRRRTEAQLREAEKMYRDLVERAPAAIYSAEPGPSGRWLYVSPWIETLSGFSAEEWESDPNLWFSHIHPDDREAFIAGETKAIAEGNQFQMEYRFFRRDGSVIWFRDESLNITSDETGKKVIVHGLLLDVTERKQAEDKLRANEALLSTIIDTIPFDFWVCDENDRYILQNPVSKALAGDIINKSLDDLNLPPDRLRELKEEHRRVLGGETVRKEDVFQTDDKQVHLMFIGAPIRDRGQINGFVGMSIDVSEQRRTLEALKETEILYRTLVEQSTVALYRDHAAPGSPSIFITPQIEKMLGYTPEEFSSYPEFWQSLLHPDDYEHVMDVVQEIINTGERVTSEYRLKSKDGRWVWIRDEARAIKDEAGNPLYVQGVYIDVTNQKLMEAQRESLIAELEAKNSELERFTYTVSHDLKAPLITMGGFLGFLEKDALNGDVENMKLDIQRIAEANRKMETLLNDLLELSRIGRLINEPENVPFGQIVADALSRVEKRLTENQIEVRVGSELPVVHGDRVRLVEVAQNLIDNAAKFTQGRPNPTIEIGAITQDGENIFFVRDNGFGIDPQYHEKIFELFTKLNPSVEGTGVGLTIVKRIVEVHGGRIWVESEPEHGATFWFTLAQK